MLVIFPVRVKPAHCKSGKPAVPLGLDRGVSLGHNAGMGTAVEERMDVVLACAGHHLHILRLAICGLRNFAPVRDIHVITASGNFARYRRCLGPDINLVNEDQLIPSMTLASLRTLPLPGFPKSAGWYYQQLLKLAFALRSDTTERCLIWDADTVLLRPLSFVDDRGRVLFTIADEYHEPYFDTFRKLLGLEPQREFSFISQHIVTDRPVLREMLERIDSYLAGNEHWAWKIMRNIKGESLHLFSEYETYGHYVKTRHPELAAFRRLTWTRDGTKLASYHPRPHDLERLAREYYFAAFERWQQPSRLLLWSVIKRLHSWSKLRR